MAGAKFSRGWSALVRGLRRVSSAVVRGIRRVVAKLPAALCDLTGFIGAASISYGAWLIYQPAGFLVAGVLLMAFALLIGRRLDARPT